MTTAVRRVYLPTPPDKYDARDQREMRRAIEQALLQVSAGNPSGSSAFGEFNIRLDPYNAVGDGVADDTEPIRAAWSDAIAAGGELVIPAGTYLVNETTADEIFLVDGPCGVVGQGINASVILVAYTVPNTVDVLHLTNPNGSEGFKGFRWEGFSVQAQAHPTLPTSYPARYGVNIDSLDGAIAYGVFDQVWIGRFGSYSWKTTAPVPPAPFVGHEIYLMEWHNCVVSGGVDFYQIGDSIRWIGGVVTGVRGFVLEQGHNLLGTVRAHGFLMDGTNVTCLNGITVLSGDGAQFVALDMEAALGISTQTNRAMIDLAGLPGIPLTNVTVRDSFLGAGATTLGAPNVDIAIRIGNAIKTHLGPNMVGSGAPPSLMYHNTDEAISTRFAWDWNVSDVLLETCLKDEGTGTVHDWIAPGSLYFMQPHYQAHKSARANMVMIEAGHEQFADQPLWGVYGNDPGPPLATLRSVAGALDVGAYRYRVAYIIDGIEHAAGSVSALAYVSTPGTIGQIDVSQIDISTDPLCTDRVIYRSKHDELVYYVHHNMGDNVTASFTDNVNDAGLGAAYSMTDGLGILKLTAGTSFGLASGRGHLRVLEDGSVIVGVGGNAGTPFQVWGSAYFDGTVSAKNAFNLLANALLIVRDSAGTPVVGLTANTTGDRFKIGYQAATAGAGSLDMHEAGNLGARLATGALQLQSGYGLEIGAGTKIAKHLSATKTWDPSNVAAAAQTTTTVTVTGAAVGDTVALGFSNDLQALMLTGYVSAANTVTVVLYNGTAAPVDLASGTLRADVWQH